MNKIQNESWATPHQEYLDAVSAGRRELGLPSDGITDANAPLLHANNRTEEQNAFVEACNFCAPCVRQVMAVDEEISTKSYEAAHMLVTLLKAERSEFHEQVDARIAQADENTARVLQAAQVFVAQVLADAPDVITQRQGLKLVATRHGSTGIHGTAVPELAPGMK